MAIARDHADQHPGDHQQHQRQRHLRDDETGAQAMLSAPGAGAAAGLERAVGIDAGQTQRGIERRGQTGAPRRQWRRPAPSSSDEYPRRAPAP